MMTATIARRFFLPFLTAFFFMLVPLRVFAADAVKPAPVVAANPMNMILGLLFLLAIVGVGWWLVKRAGGLQINGGSGMKVIATVSVGPRERVVLIELAGEQWLLGVAPGCVNLLHRFDHPVVAVSNGDFGEKIRQLMQQGLHK